MCSCDCLLGFHPGAWCLPMDTTLVSNPPGRFTTGLLGRSAGARGTQWTGGYQYQYQELSFSTADEFSPSESRRHRRVPTEGHSTTGLTFIRTKALAPVTWASTKSLGYHFHRIVIMAAVAPAPIPCSWVSLPKLDGGGQDEFDSHPYPCSRHGCGNYHGDLEKSNA